MYKHKRTDFIESDLRPGVVESHRSLMSLLENAQDQFERNKSRLQVVREEKEQKRHQLLGESCPLLSSAWYLTKVFPCREWRGCEARCFGERPVLGHQ